MTRSRLAHATTAAVVAALFALLMAMPGLAQAQVVTATTTGGGSCQIQSTLTTTGFGVNGGPCTARFGINRMESLGFLYDGTGQQTDFMPHAVGFSNSKSTLVLGTRVSRIDVSVILNSGTIKTKSCHRTRRGRRRCHNIFRLEHWRTPPAGCRVKTTLRAGDTLGCILSDRVG